MFDSYHRMTKTKLDSIAIYTSLKKVFNSHFIKYFKSVSLFHCRIDQPVNFFLGYTRLFCFIINGQNQNPRLKKCDMGNQSSTTSFRLNINSNLVALVF